MIARRVALVGMLCGVTALADVAARASQAVGGAGESAFAGTWSASGERRTVPTEDGGSAAIVHLQGPVALSAGEGLGRGFHGEVIGFDDGHGLRAGRWVWTDRRGDRIYGQFQGEGVRTGQRFMATITGGSGAYAGLSGDYEFTWKYVVVAEDGTVQGRSTDLKGRYRGRP